MTSGCVQSPHSKLILILSHLIFVSLAFTSLYQFYLLSWFRISVMQPGRLSVMTGLGADVSGVEG